MNVNNISRILQILMSVFATLLPFLELKPEAKGTNILVKAKK